MGKIFGRDDYDDGHAQPIVATETMRQYLKDHPGSCYGVHGKLLVPAEMDVRRKAVMTRTAKDNRGLRQSGRK